MQPPPSCSECGNPVPPDAPLGLCPQCLIGQARPGGKPVAPPPGPAAGRRIGPYTLLEQIGEGGFGVVFLAEQQQPIARRVALKVVKEGMDTRQVIARFEAERQALAMMDHPNIAKVFDAGATESGRPFFVMERVRGIPLVRFCDEQRLGTRERLELFMEVCSAVQHAHQKGVIHRDLKPSNILVGMEEGKAVPKVIDFGIAKATGPTLTESTLFTRLDQFVGTPLYISPEQARLGATDVDTRSDIYSLGVILYELLTGKPPLDPDRVARAGLQEMMRMIREADVPRPSARLTTLSGQEVEQVARARRTEPRKLGLLMRGDLDWIVLKAIEKERNRRYDTANALRLDIARFLADEPVSAAAPGRLYRFRKFARRHRGPLLSSAAILVAILTGAFFSFREGVRATREATRSHRLFEQATAARETAEENLYRMAILMSQSDYEDGRIGAVRETLDEHLPEGDEVDRRGWEWFYLKSRIQQPDHTLETGQGRLWAARWSPDGNRFASAGQDGTVAIWDARTLERLTVLEAHGGPVRALAWNPRDPDLLASAGRDQRVLVWSLAEARPAWEFTGHQGPVLALAWHAGGRVLASGSEDGRIVVADLDAGKVVDSEALGRPVHSLAWHPGSPGAADVADVPADACGVLVAGTDSQGVGYGQTLAVYSYHEEAGSPGTNPLRVLGTRPAPRGLANALEWSPDGTSLAGLAMSTLFIRQGLDAGPSDEAHLAHRSTRGTLAWHPSEQVLATGGGDQVIKVWKTGVPTPLASLCGHREEVTAVAWHPTEERLLSASRDGTAMLWSPWRGAKGAVLHHAPNWVSEVAWSPDGSELAVASWHRSVFILDGSTGEIRHTLPPFSDKVPSVSWNAEGSRIASACYNSKVRISDAGTGATLEVLDHEESQDLVAWSPDSTRLVSRSWRWCHQFGQDPLKLTVWHFAEGREPSPMVLRDPEREDEAYVAAHCFAWHPQHNWLATGSMDGQFILWDGESGAVLGRIDSGCPERLNSLAWDSRGDKLAVGDSGGHLSLLELRDGKFGRPRYVRKVFTAEVSKIDWSPSDTRLGASGVDGTIKIIAPLTGDRLLSLLDPEEGSEPGEVFSLDWCPDGRRIATGGYDARVRIWDATRGYPGWEALVPPGDSPSLLHPPASAEVARRKARVLIDEHGKWKEARSTLEHFFDETPEAMRPLDIFALGMLLAREGEVGAHRDLCRWAVARHADSESSMALDVVAKTFLFTRPEPGSELTRTSIAMARRSTEGGPGQPLYAWRALCRGLAELRDDQPEEALEWLAVSVQHPAHPACRAAADALRAISAHRLGDHHRAMHWLSEARQRLDDLEQRSDGWWADLIAARLALEEAQARILAE